MRFPPAYQKAVIESMRSGMSLEFASRFYGIRKEVLLRWAEGAEMLCDDEPDPVEQRIAELEGRVEKLEAAK